MTLLDTVAAAATVGLPLIKLAWDTRKSAKRSERLLTGEADINGDGVIPRLSDVEARTDLHEQALRQERALPLTDGGEDQEEQTLSTTAEAVEEDRDDGEDNG